MVEYQLPKLATGVRFPSLAVSGLALLSLFVFCIFSLIGCATVPPYKPTAVEIPRLEGGIYHEIAKGDTLWSIARTYGVDLADVIRANGFPDITKISPGQKIFIPGSKKVLPIQTRETKFYKQDIFIWPIEGGVISYFGQENYGTRNKGIDIETGERSNVVASKGGKVVFCSNNIKGMGKILIIDHKDGFFTVYARNFQNLVRVGDYVNQGQVIAMAGSTGRGYKPYLHFEIRRRYKPQNPLYYLP